MTIRASGTNSRANFMNCRVFDMTIRVKKARELANDMTVRVKKTRALANDMTARVKKTRELANDMAVRVFDIGLGVPDMP